MFKDLFPVLPPSGAAEIIYVINNSNGGSANTSELTSGGPRLLKAGSLNNSIGKIGGGRPLHIRTDLLPAALSEGSSVLGGDVGGEVVEEEVVVGAEVGFEGHQQPEITFIDQEEEEEEHKTEETVTVYEVVGDEVCHDDEWVGGGLEHHAAGGGAVRDDEGGGDVEEMVFEEEAVEEGEQVIYVTDDGVPVEGDVTFMQVFFCYDIKDNGKMLNVNGGSFG